MKEPKVDMLPQSSKWVANGTFTCDKRSLISHCSSPTTCRVFYQWMSSPRPPQYPGRAIVAVVHFHGGETPAERIAVMDNVVALCEAARGV